MRFPPGAGPGLNRLRKKAMIERKSADERPAGAKALIIIQALAARDPDPAQRAPRYPGTPSRALIQSSLRIEFFRRL